MLVGMTENFIKASTICPNNLMGWQEGSVFGHLNNLCHQLDGWQDGILLGHLNNLCHQLDGWQNGILLGHLNNLCHQLDGMAGWNFIK